MQASAQVAGVFSIALLQYFIPAQRQTGPTAKVTLMNRKIEFG